MKMRFNQRRFNLGLTLRIGEVSSLARIADPNRRDDILKVSRQVFQEQGFSKARTAEIAARAGIASGTLYLYFPSKEAIVLALADDYFNRLNQLLAAELEHFDQPEALAKAIHIALDFASQESDMIRLLPLDLGMGNPGVCHFSPARFRLTQVLSMKLAEGIEKGYFRPHNSKVMADMIAGMVEWVAETCLVRGGGSLQEYEASLVETLQKTLLVDNSANGKVAKPRARKRDQTFTHD
jgi:AcrR family transcriptional regulator